MRSARAVVLRSRSKSADSRRLAPRGALGFPAGRSRRAARDLSNRESKRGEIANTRESLISITLWPFLVSISLVSLSIHPTAIVDPRAQLADDVRVDAYAIIEGR